MSGTHLDDASLDVADLRGLYLRHARGLTSGQLKHARGNAQTTLREHLDRPEHWPTDD